MNGSDTFSPMFQITLNKMIRDMNFLGMFYIIIGAIYSLTIIGALLGIPFIISGLRLRESANSFSSYSASSDTFSLEQALERQGKFFFIQKILIIITIVLSVLSLIFMIIFGVYVSQYLNQYNYYST
jgi:hypothetical protein